jgi:hypothetical protein
MRCVSGANGFGRPLGDYFDLNASFRPGTIHPFHDSGIREKR